MPDLTYFAISLVGFAMWTALYCYRRDLRREMLLMSISVALVGLLLERFVWTQDWWVPKTMTGTIIGIEDALFGFASGGISSVIYEVVFRKKANAPTRGGNRKHTTLLLGLVGVSFATLGILFFIFKVHSFYASVAGMLLPLFIIYFLRKDLIVSSLLSGSLITFAALGGYALLHLIYPGWIYEWWLFEHLTGLVVVGAPLEDLAWFFVTGSYLSCIYKFWTGSKFASSLKQT